MPSTGAKLGMDAKAYRGSAGDNVGDMTLLTNVTDVTINLETAESDVTTRGNNGWRATEPTLRDGSVDFEMIAADGDADVAAIQAAFFNTTLIGMAFLDEENGDGLVADFKVTNFTRSEALEEAIRYQVTVKPAFSQRSPEWVTGGGSGTGT